MRMITSSCLSGCRSRDYSSQDLVEHGNGPPGVGTLGIAAYANVPTKPTKSSNALSERFMVDFLLRVLPKASEKLQACSGENYTQPCNFLINRRLLKAVERGEELTGTPKIEGIVRQAIGTVFTLVS